MKQNILLISAVLLASCGGANNSSNSGSTNLLPEEVQDLKGSWISNCLPDDDAVESLKILTQYSNKGVTGTFFFYNDTSCLNKTFSTRINGAITYEGEKISESGLPVKKVIEKIDLKKISLAIDDTELLSDYNNVLACNRNDWERSEYVNISNCTALSAVVDSFKDPMISIYYINGDDLYWDDIDSTIDNDGFPNKLETTPSFTKL